jgi:hypothetical protein
LKYFTNTWHSLWKFDLFCGHLVYFSPVSVFCTKINLATLVCVDLLPPITSINSINHCVRKLFHANSKDLTPPKNTKNALDFKYGQLSMAFD